MSLNFEMVFSITYKSLTMKASKMRDEFHCYMFCLIVAWKITRILLQ